MKFWSEIDTNIWEYTDKLKAPGGIWFPIRSTAIRLKSGEIWLHSPCSFTKEGVRELRTLGKVRYIIAPNAYHHLFVAKSSSLFPDAQIWCAPGIEKKHPGLSMTGFLGVDPPWMDEISTQGLGGAPMFNEYVFFHIESQSFVCSDFLFNMHSFENMQTKLMMFCVGANKGLAQSRAWRLFVKEKKVIGNDAQKILLWDFKRIVMAHGDIVDSPDVKTKLGEAAKWMLSAAS